MDFRCPRGKNRDYQTAIGEYSESIALLGAQADQAEHLHLYNDRAQAYLFADDYQAALRDFSYVLEKETITLNDKVNSKWGILRCYAHLEDIPRFEDTLAEIKVLDPNYPQVESTKEYLIFKNFHSLSPCSKKRFTCAMIHFDICNTPEDIIFTDTGVCLIKKKCHCGCEKSKTENRAKEICECEKSVELNSQAIFGPMMTGKDVGQCKYWCDRASNAAMLLCAKTFKTFRCQYMCTEVVEALKDGCYWCCEGEGFYKRCVQPFEEYLLQVPCDPAWD